MFWQILENGLALFVPGEYRLADSCKAMSDLSEYDFSTNRQREERLCDSVHVRDIRGVGPKISKLGGLHMLMVPKSLLSSA